MQLNEIGRTLLNLCSVVPDGIVVFFPSYHYEETVYNFLHANGTIQKIDVKKKVERGKAAISNFIVYHLFFDATMQCLLFLSLIAISVLLFYSSFVSLVLRSNWMKLSESIKRR